MSKQQIGRGPLRAILCGVVLGGALALCLVPRPAHAQVPLSEASALADQGYQHFRKGEYAEAIALFRQAEQLSHSPVILSFIAQSHEAMGQLLEAQATYERITREDLGDNPPEDFVAAQARARRLAPLLAQRIPRLRLRVFGVASNDVRVELDGEPFPSGLLDTAVPVDPGSRLLRLYVGDNAPVERPFEATERTTSEVDVVFSTVERRTTEGLATGRWLPPALAFGFGFAGFTVGITTAAFHFDRAARLRDRCPENQCAPELESERDTIAALGVASVVAHVVGGVGTSVGLIWVIADGADDGDVALVPGPGGVALTGRF